MLTKQNKFNSSPLHSNALFHRSIVETSLDGFCLLNADGVITEVNSAFCQLSAYSENEVIGMNISELNVGESNKGISSHLPKVLQSGASRFETQVQQKSGTICDLEVCIQYKEINGKWFIAFFRNIAEQKKATLLLSKNTDRLEYALNSIETGAWELDLKVFDAWRMFKHDQIFGYKKLLDEWTYDMFLQHVIPEDREHVDKKFKHALETKTEWSFECRIKRVDNNEIRWIWATGNQEFDKNGEPDKMFGIVQDITKRKETELLIKENAERFLLAFNQQFQFMAILNPQGKVIEINELPLKIQGLTRDDYQGRYFWDAPTWRNNTKIQKKIKEQVLQTTKQHSPLYTEDVFYAEDGTLHEARAVYSSIRDSENKVRYILVQATDISNQKHTELKLADSENYLSVVFNNTVDAQLLTKYHEGENFRVVAVNNAYIKKLSALGLQVTTEDIIGNDLKHLLLNIIGLSETIYKYTLGYYLDAIQSQKQIKINESFEINNQTYHSKTSYSPIFKEEDNSYYILYNSHDTTAENEAKKQLQESEERFSLAVKGSNDAIWDWDDLESDEYWWSDRLYEMLGYQPGEVEARISNWIKWMHPDDSKHVTGILNAHFEVGLPYELEFRMKKKDGNYVWLFVRGESVRDKDGKPIRMAGSVTDITARKLNDERILNQLNDLKRWQTLMLNRESRNIELKNEINQLLKEQGKAPRYSTFDKE